MNPLIDSLDARINDLMLVKEETVRLLKQLEEEQKAFSPEKAGFVFVTIDIKSANALYHHPTYQLPNAARRLSLIQSIGKSLGAHTDARYHLSSFYESSNLNQFNGLPFSGHFLYKGDITSQEHYDSIIKEVIKFKLLGDEVVICKTEEERERVLDAYMTLDVPKQYFDELVFKSRVQYDAKQFPNFRWKFSRNAPVKHWEEPSSSKHNSYLQAFGDPKKCSPWEVSMILSVEEFVKRMKNHERGD